MKLQMVLGILVVSALLTTGVLVKPLVEREESPASHVVTREQLGSFDPEFIAPGCDWVVEGENPEFLALAKIDLSKLVLVEVPCKIVLDEEGLPLAVVTKEEILFTIDQQECIPMGGQVARYLCENPELIPKGLMRPSSVWGSTGSIFFYGTMVKGSRGQFVAAISRGMDGTWGRNPQPANTRGHRVVRCVALPRCHAVFQAP